MSNWCVIEIKNIIKNVQFCFENYNTKVFFMDLFGLINLPL